MLPGTADQAPVVGKTFRKDMTIAQALAAHPKATEVFTRFHLGGCAHCPDNEIETIEPVCQEYNIDVEEFLGALEALMSE